MFLTSKRNNRWKIVNMNSKSKCIKNKKRMVNHPSFNNLVHTKYGRLSALNGTVENSTVEQRTMIMTFNLVG